MPAISFQPEFLDALLFGDKQQTTRPMPPVPPRRPRFRVGDILHVYNQQRRRITDKPLRMCTNEGKWIVRGLMKKRHHYPQLFYDSEGGKIYPHLLDWGAKCVCYPAHFLGKLGITEVYDIHPCEMSGEDLKAWALADGFKDFHPTVIPPNRLYDGANMWFQLRYGDDWMQKMWTVIQWDGWDERYFEPENL